MGSYGIGPARIVAAAIEQGADEQGHRVASRDRALAGHVVALGKPGRRGGRGGRAPLRGARRGRGRGRSRRARGGAGREADRRRAARDARCGSWSASGRLAEGEVETQVRRTGRGRAPPGRGARRAPMLSGLLDGRRARPRPRVPALGHRPLAGRRRARRAAGEPLHPLTLPNLVGYLRIAGDPGLPRPRARARATGGPRPRRRSISGSRRATTSTASSPARPASTAAWARSWTPSSTGSRRSPGAVVCWHFELLPRWALALLAVREVGSPSCWPRSACAGASTSRSTGSGASPSADLAGSS